MSTAVHAVHAPGKLYIAGEYAVLRPGGAAILAAVDRTITAQASSAVTGAPSTGTFASEITGGAAVPWHRSGDTVEMPGADADRTAHVRAAIAAAEQYAAEHGADDAPLAVEVASQMTEGGVKLGLGSSGAVTVATVAAVLAARGVTASARQIYRIAMLAAVAVDPRGSGGDIAAASHGGWVRYRSPDRDALRARLDAGDSLSGIVADPWPGHVIETLPAPADLRLRVGWTGSPASTAAHVSRLRSAERGAAPDLRAFESASDECVAALAAALRTGDARAFADGIIRARGLLDTLAQDTGMGIVTAELAALCAGADDLGAPAKSSGAGGGDCGIAFASSQRQSARLDAAWRAVGVRPLELGTYATPVEVKP